MENRTKKKILHVIGNLEGGGAERQLNLIANHTDLSQYHVSILFLHPGTGQYVYHDKIDLIQIPRGRKWNLFSLWLRVYRTVRAYRPDILQLWLPEIVTIPAALAGKLSGAYIVSCARRSMRSVHSIKSRLRDTASYIQHFMADQIAANFNPDKEPWFYRCLFSRKKGCVIRNAIVIDSADSARGDSPDIRKGTSFTLWYVGRITPQKRLDILLDSLIQLRKEGLNMSLVICGTGRVKLLEQLKETVKTSGMEEHILFAGYRNDWHCLAQNADLFVLPSTAEGMPNVLFEAMLLGLPCVVTDIPVIRDLVSHKSNVWMARAGSCESLASGIREMYQSDALRQQIAQAGQHLAKRFSIEEMTRAYNAIYASRIN